MNIQEWEEVLLNLCFFWKQVPLFAQLVLEINDDNNNTLCTCMTLLFRGPQESIGFNLAVFGQIKLLFLEECLLSCVIVKFLQLITAAPAVYIYMKCMNVYVHVCISLCLYVIILREQISSRAVSQPFADVAGLIAIL